MFSISFDWTKSIGNSLRASTRIYRRTALVPPTEIETQNKLLFQVVLVAFFPTCWVYWNEIAFVCFFSCNNGILQ